MAKDIIQPITREYLYNLIADNFSKIKKFLINEHNENYIISIFKDSAKFVSYFEKELANGKDYTLSSFDFLIKKALDNVKEESLREFINLKIIQKTEEKFKGNDYISYKAIIISIFKEIANFHNNIIKKNFETVWFSHTDEKPKFSVSQTFLSYAYYDKGITLGLYIHFINNNGFLYVNWMWSGTNDDSSLTKKQLNSELAASNQLLFLRTLNSELNYYGGSHIRQWCSWEIGNYYTKNSNEKYYLDLYGTGVRGNDLLSSFKTFLYVKNGIING